MAMSRKTKKKTASEQPQDTGPGLPERMSERFLPFNTLHSDRFEHLCVELVEALPGIQRAETKRGPGVAQYGVDVEGFNAAQVPVTVLSAKVRQKTTAGEIKEWSDDFLDHWDGHWKSKGVNCFILAVTVPLNDDDLNAAFATEAARFRALGLDYEPWGQQQLTKGMKGIPARIEGYFPPGWRAAITGASANDPSAYALAPTRTTTPRPATSVEPLSAAAAQEIAARYGAEVANNLEAALDRFRDGRHDPLKQFIARLKDDRAAFDLLSSEVKARLLRAEATLAIARSDPAATRALLNQAAHFHAPPDRVGEAQALRLEGQPEAAITLLASPANAREVEILLALILEQRGPDAMFQRMDALAPPDSPEIWRLRAVAHFLAGRDDDAVLAVDAAVAAAPGHFTGLIASAIIRFGASLSPSAPRQFGSFPNPVHPSLARDDDSAVQRRREALTLFQRLSQECDGLREDLAIWTIAAQLVGKDTEQAGYEALGNLVRQSQPPSGAILWALAFGVNFNPKTVQKMLLQRLDAGKGSSIDLAALIALRGSHNARKTALNDIARYAPQFPLPGDQEQIAYWRSQLSSDAGDATAFRDALIAVRRNKNPGPLMAFLATTANAEFLLGGAETMARHGLLDRVNDLRMQLLALKTADSTELAVQAAIAAGDGIGAGALIDAAAPLYPHGQLPHRMRVFQINAALSRGEIGNAVRMLEGAADGKPSDFLQLQSAKIRASAGDIRGASRILSQLSPEACFPVREVMPLVSLLRREEPIIARALLESTAPEELANAWPIEGYSLARELGSRRIEQALAPAFEQAAHDSSKVLVLDTMEQVHAEMQRQQEELETLRKQWLSGQFPIHLLLDQKPHAFLAAVLGRCPADTEFILDWPMLLRAGLPRHDPVEVQGKEIRLDITAAVLAGRLGILEQLDALGTVRVPLGLADAISFLLQTIDANAATTIAAIEAVQAAITSGRLLAQDIHEPDAVVIDFPTGGDGPLDAGFAMLVRRAAEAGPKMQAWLSTFADRAGESEAPPASHFVLNVSDAVALARSAMLDEAVAWGVFLFPRKEEAGLRNGLARSRGEMERAKVLQNVRDIVARRLLDGTWTQISMRPDAETKALGQKGPILGSLLNLVQAPGAGSVTWVEDRAASAAVMIGTSRCIDVFDVLAALQGAGKLTPRALQDAETALMQMGYGNLPYDLERTLQLVRAAPVVGGRVVETVALTALRRHFAVQMDRLRYANPNIRTPSADGEQNEARFGAWHMHLSNRLLPQLFTDAAMPMEEIVARANWIWDNCTVDQAGFLPIQGAPSPAVNRTLVRGSLDGLICSVLQLQVGDSQTERACRERYSIWLYNHVVAPAAQFDPPLAEEMLADVAKSFADIIQTPEEEEVPGLARMSRVMVLRTIDPMPEPWRSRLLSVPVLHDKLKLKRGGTIALRPDVTFSADSFYQAIAALFAGGGGTLKTNEGAMTLLELEGTTLTVILDADRFVLSDPNLGLAQSDEAGRRASYAHVAKELDLQPDEIEPFWKELESRDLPARFQLLNQRKAESYQARFMQLDAELRGARRFEADLLAPPEPAAMLRYLRMPAATTAHDLAGAFDQVASEFDLFEALKRTAGLPMPYSTDIDTRLAAAITQLDGGEQGHAPSPLYGLKSALSLRDAEKPLRERAISDALGAMENLSGLFLTILRWSARKVRFDPKWQALSADLRQALLWAHADLLTAHLAVAKTEPEATSELFEQLDRFGVWELLIHGEKPVEDAAGFETSIGLKVWLGGLLGAGFGADGMDDAAKLRLRTMTGQENNGEWMPQFIAVARPDDPPFGSLADAIVALNSSGVLTAAGLADGSTPAELIDRFLKEGDTQESGEVSGALPIFRVRDIPVGKIAEILSVVARFKPFEVYPVNTPTYNMWFSLLGSLYGRLGDTAGFHHLMEERLPAARAAGGRATEAAFDAFAEAAFHFAQAHDGSPVERLKILLTLLNQFGNIVDEAASTIRRLIAGMISSIPAEEGAPLWDAYLKWRRA